MNVTAGNSANVVIPAGSLLAVKVSLNGFSEVKLLQGVDAGNSFSVDVNEYRYFGPYGSDVSATVFCRIGTVEYLTTAKEIGIIVGNQAVGLAAQLAAGLIQVNPLRKWQKALANVRAGKANATIACVGDSTTAGCDADGVNVWTNAKILSYPTALAAALIAAGIPSGIGSVTSDNSTIGHSGTIPQFDPRVAHGANWGAGAQGPTAGGQMIGTIAGAVGILAAETFTFSPVASFDTVEVYWYRTGATGVFTIDCGGAVLATANTGATGLVKTVVTKAPGVGVVNLIRTVAPGCAVIGINTYLSTTKSVNVLNMGWSGAAAGPAWWTFNSGLYGPINVLANGYQADLTIICLGINEAVLGTVSTIAANLITLITTCLTTGDVILVYPVPVDATAATLANQAAVYAAITAAAAATGVLTVDLQYRWGDYATSSAYYFTDKVHPIQIGYQDMATAIVKAVLAA